MAADGVPRQPRQSGGLTQSLVLLLGFCCLISVSVNFLHGSSISHHTADMALAKAMKEFTEGYKSSNMAMKKLVASLQAEEDEEEESDSSTSQLAGLNCEKYVGPSSEVAQEMVYWSDIPEDAHYVSPFHDNEHRQYMTFEPGKSALLSCYSCTWRQG